MSSRNILIFDLKDVNMTNIFNWKSLKLCYFYLYSVILQAEIKQLCGTSSKEELYSTYFSIICNQTDMLYGCDYKEVEMKVKVIVVTIHAKTVHLKNVFKQIWATNFEFLKCITKMWKKKIWPNINNYRIYSVVSRALDCKLHEMVLKN